MTPRRGRPLMTATLTFDDETLGDAMRALTPGQRAFVHYKVQLGINNTEAARMAGYSATSPTVLSVTAHRLAHTASVQAALVEESRKLLRSEGAKSVLTLVALRDDPEIDPKTRLKAAVEIANRAGLHAVSESHLTVEHHLSEAETDRRILALAAELWLSPDQAQKMLVAPADMARNAAGVFELTPAVPKPEASPQQKHANERRRARRKMSSEEAAADKAAVRAEHAERLRREYQEAQATVTDAEYTEVEPDPLADLADVL
jgi:hypothetical protein